MVNIFEDIYFELGELFKCLTYDYLAKSLYSQLRTNVVKNTLKHIWNSAQILLKNN